MKYKIIRLDGTIEYRNDSNNVMPIGAMALTDIEYASGIPAPILTFVQIQIAAIAKTYSDVDAIYTAAVGNREAEYIQAEQDARAFKAAGYVGTPSAYISGWATVKSITNQAATDAIIAKADALQTAKLSLRNTRFTSQAAIQNSTTQAQLDTAVATWNAFISTTKTSLGLP